MAAPTKTLTAGLLASASLMTVAADDNPLACELGRTRPLVVVVPTANHPLLTGLQAQLRQAEMRRRFDEREMILFTVIGDQGHREGLPLSETQTRSMMAALELPANSPVMVFLVGKDGGIKLSEHNDQVSLEDVFGRIDTMPMRRR